MTRRSAKDGRLHVAHRRIDLATTALPRTFHRVGCLRQEKGRPIGRTAHDILKTRCRRIRDVSAVVPRQQPDKIGTERAQFICRFMRRKQT